MPTLLSWSVRQIGWTRFQVFMHDRPYPDKCMNRDGHHEQRVVESPPQASLRAKQDLTRAQPSLYGADHDAYVAEDERRHDNSADSLDKVESQFRYRLRFAPDYSQC